MTAPLGHLLTR